MVEPEMILDCAACCSFSEQRGMCGASEDIALMYEFGGGQAAKACPHFSHIPPDTCPVCKEGEYFEHTLWPYQVDVGGTRLLHVCSENCVDLVTAQRVINKAMAEVRKEAIYNE